MKAGEMIAKFRASNPNPTRGEYYNECVNQSNVIRPIYRDDIDTPTGQAEIASDCETQTSRKYDVSSQWTLTFNHTKTISKTQSQAEPISLWLSSFYVHNPAHENSGNATSKALSG